jgi:nucleotide-binding universal stress UspA family protein
LVRLSEQAHRLVIGAPAEGRLERLLAGSVTLPVVAHAGCPVVVVPAGTAVSPPKRIVVGVDGSEHSALAVEFAFSTAQACGASVECVLVSSLDASNGTAAIDHSSSGSPAAHSRGTDLLHRTVDPIAERFPEVPVGMDLCHGSHAKALVQAAADVEADLLVVGSRGRGGFRGLLLGSVSRRVVAHAHCVVAVVRGVHD